MPAQLTVTRLHKRYGAVVAAADINFEIGTGEIFGLLGPNGAGKTTVLECIVGLKQPDAGEVSIAGIDVRTNPRGAHEKLGVSLQNSGLPDTLTPREALWLFGSFYGRRDNSETQLSQFGLQDKADAHYGTLSVGQRQRLALALAMVNEPTLLILDEPSGGLDPEARRELHGCLQAMRASGTTILLSTHDLGEATELCDRVAVLRKGRLVALDSPQRLRDTASCPQSIRFRSNPKIEPRELAELAGVQSVVPLENCERLFTNAPSTTLQALNRLIAERRLEISELHVETSDLAGAYFEITSETNAELRS